MADKLQLSIVTPNKNLISAECDMVILPSTEGDMGVMAGHTAMIVAMQAGTISVWDNNKILHNIVIHSGFAEISGEICTILAESAVLEADIALDDLKQNLNGDDEHNEDYVNAQITQIENPSYR